jgi:nicotinate-nucleotide adenylyltransferase
MAKRLGIMGGTFNPVHNGHLRIAEIAQRELELDEVRFIPTGDSPHKRVDVSGTSRLEMVRLAVDGHPGFTVSDMEIARVGRSYTCDTLRALRAQEPGAELFFILGGDMIMDITSWRNPDVIVRLAVLATVPRPGDDAGREGRVCEYLRMEYGADVRVMSEAGPEISSTEIRRRVNAGEDISGLVPANVERYIYSRGLYQALETRNDA